MRYGAVIGCENGCKEVVKNFGLLTVVSGKGGVDSFDGVRYTAVIEFRVNIFIKSTNVVLVY